eukprot:gene32055-36817_t
MALVAANELDTEADCIIDDSRQVIDTVIADFRQSALKLSRTVDQLEEENREVDQEVCDILINLQFQDRISQILDHVQLDMTKLVGLIESAATAPLPETWLHELEQTYTTLEQRQIHAGQQADNIALLPHLECSVMSSKTILIVDDSFSLRQTISLALQSANYEVVEAIDGCDALKKLDGRKYNLIISDVNMPNLDGLSFVRELKQLPDYKFTPVIMLTTESADSRKQEGRAIGVRAWEFAMPVTQSIHDGLLRLQISGSFTIFQAREYKEQLLHELE